MDASIVTTIAHQAAFELLNNSFIVVLDALKDSEKNNYRIWLGHRAFEFYSEKRILTIYLRMNYWRSWIDMFPRITLIFSDISDFEDENENCNAPQNIDENARFKHASDKYIITIMKSR